MMSWLLVLLLLAAPQESQDSAIDARLSATLSADTLPDRDATELRPQVAGSITVAPRPGLTLRLDGAVDGLLADRGTRIRTVEIRVKDAWIEAAGRRADVRAGYGRLVWGRLDEIAPSDVINPLDAAKFLFEGRSEARLAVPFVRARLLPSDRVRLEGVVVPRFRRGTYDLLDEDTSPFNLTRDLILPANVLLASGRRHAESPSDKEVAGALSGGGRVQFTLGRVDVSASAYRGVDAFGPVAFEVLPPADDAPATAVVGQLVEYHPRFTMYAGDVETVTGDWAWRGEAAFFADRRLSGVTVPGFVEARSLDAGFGFDRRAGSLTIFGSAIVHHERSDVDPGVRRTDVSLVGSIDRAFAGDRVRIRGFAVANPGDKAGFVRGVFLWKPRDRVTVDVSAGSFLGSGDDTISRFEGRDFVVARLRYDFR